MHAFQMRNYANKTSANHVAAGVKDLRPSKRAKGRLYRDGSHIKQVFLEHWLIRNGPPDRGVQGNSKRGGRISRNIYSFFLKSLTKCPKRGGAKNGRPPPLCTPMLI